MIKDRTQGQNVPWPNNISWTLQTSLNMTAILVYVPTTDAEEKKAEGLYGNLQS